MDEHNYSEGICLEGSIAITICFLTYFSCYTYVICLARKQKDWMNVGFISLFILTFPNFYAFVSAFGRFWVYTASKSEHEQCFIYHPRSIFGYIVVFLSIINSVLIQVFLLRILYIASILKSESKEQEQKAENNINLLQRLYIPIYFITQCGICFT